MSEIVVEELRIGREKRIPYSTNRGIKNPASIPELTEFEPDPARGPGIPTGF
jgi:hypothetical protein